MFSPAAIFERTHNFSALPWNLSRWNQSSMAIASFNQLEIPRSKTMLIAGIGQPRDPRQNLVIFLVSHSSNHYTWHMTIGLLRKYWEHYRFVWAVDESSMVNNYTAGWIRCMRHAGWRVMTYRSQMALSPRLSALLQSPEFADSDYVLFLLEDWLAVGKVSDVILSNVLRAMEVYSLDHVRNSRIPKEPKISEGFPHPDPQVLNTTLLPYSLWKISTDASYFVNIQPAIWRRSGLLKLLGMVPGVESYGQMEEMAFGNPNAIKSAFRGRFAALDTSPPQGPLWSGIFPHWHGCLGNAWVTTFMRDVGGPQRPGASLHELLVEYGIDYRIKNVGRGYVWDQTWPVVHGWLPWAGSVQNVTKKLTCATWVDSKANTVNFM